MLDDDSDSTQSTHISSVTSSSQSTRTSFSSVQPSLPPSTPSKSKNRSISKRPSLYSTTTRDRRRSESQSQSPSRSGSRSRAGELLGQAPTRYQPYTRRHTVSSGEQSVDQIMTTDISPVEARELFARGVAHMSQDSLKKALFAKEASREYQRQNLLATAWKIEELRRFLDLMEGIQEENKGQLDEASTDLTHVQSFLSETSLSEIRSETTRLQRSYDQDLSELSTIDNLLDRLEQQYSHGGPNARGRT